MNVITEFMRLTEDIYIQLDNTWHWWFADDVLFAAKCKLTFVDLPPCLQKN